MSTPFSSCWTVTDGKSGMESQCLGLAEALGIDPIIKRIALRNPWRDLSPHLRVGLQHAFHDNPLVPPWPDLLIATGRQSVPASLYVKQMSSRTRRVQIQNPGISPRHFDLVVTPMHDNLWGANVIQTIGALHRVTPEKLAQEAALLEPRLAGLPRPFIGVLIGGANAVYRFGVEEAKHLGTEIARHAATSGGSVLITPSRRTGDENIAALRAALGTTPGFVWDETGANPYFGILACADVLLVTGDSVNMVTEACASDHPVYIYALPGGSTKFQRFHDALVLRGYARRYEGSLEIAPSNRLYEMTRVARAVAQLGNRNS
ncbi:MAG TPA: mitochondrial fission ELM1 family protein [Rhizomicrobium sp.]